MKLEFDPPISGKWLGELDSPSIVESATQWTRDQLFCINLGNGHKADFRFYDYENNPNGLKMLCRYTKPLDLIRLIYPRTKDAYIYYGLVLPSLRLPQLRTVSVFIDQVLEFYDKESYQDFGFEDYEDFHKKTDKEKGDGYLYEDIEQIFDRKEEKLVDSKILSAVFSQLANYYSRINNISLLGNLFLYGYDHPTPIPEPRDHRGYYAYDTGKSIYLNVNELSSGHSTRPKQCNDFLETTVHEWIHHLLMVLDREHGLFDPTDTTPDIAHSRMFDRIEKKLGIPKEEATSLNGKLEPMKAFYQYPSV